MFFGSEKTGGVAFEPPDNNPLALLPGTPRHKSVVTLRRAAEKKNSDVPVVLRSVGSTPGRNVLHGAIVDLFMVGCQWVRQYTQSYF